MDIGLVKHQLIRISFLFLIFFSLAILSQSPHTYAEPATDTAHSDAAINIPDMIKLTLSENDLLVNNLTPGSAADSNVITATITSNSAYGYHLSATVETNGGTTDLINNSNTSSSFASLGANVLDVTNISDNSWGYYWSSTNYSTSMARFLYVGFGSGNNTDVAKSDSKQFALSVRCLVAE